jgi:hypothetical protein
MPTEQIDLTTEQSEMTAAQTELITEQTGLLEKLNCLEFETSQLTQAFQLWRSYVEQGTVPDWMAAATRTTYDALITFYLEVSTILADVPHAFSTKYPARLESAPREISGILGQERTTAQLPPESSPMEPDCSEQIELTAEQTELIEKLDCLEFESSQLSRAYQLWTSYVEQGTAPDWMAVAIWVTYDALIKFCLEVSTILADGPHAFSVRRLARLEAVRCETSGIFGEEGTTPEPPPELLPTTQPDWSAPEMPVALVPASTGETSSELLVIPQGQQEEEADGPHASSARLLAQLRAAACSTSGSFAEEEDTTSESSPELLPMTEPDWSGPEMPADIFPPSTGDAIPEQPGMQYGQQDEEAGAEILGILEEEYTTTEPSPELLPMTEPDWSGHEMPVTISPASADAAIPGQPAIQKSRQEGVGAEPAALPSLATLANWLQESSTGLLFFIPPGVLGRLFRATLVAILVVAGGIFGIYVASARRAAPKPAVLPVQNSAAPPAAGVVAIPTGGKAEFKFDPDPVVAPLGRSFVLNAVLSRGLDVASLAVQIDYDANLLQFTGVSPGGFLVKHGQRAALVQHDDPVTGVLKISAEQSPGSPGISGDGPVFTLSFQARKRGKATVSIVPGAHDSQGRRIEMAGSQVSVRVN